MSLPGVEENFRSLLTYIRLNDCQLQPGSWFLCEPWLFKLGVFAFVADGVAFVLQATGVGRRFVVEGALVVGGVRHLCFYGKGFISCDCITAYAYGDEEALLVRVTEQLTAGDDTTNHY